MDSGMIGKVEKAHRYSAEPDRFSFSRIEVDVHGDNSDHRVSLEGDTWTCNCEFFGHHHACAHTMALQLMLGQMLPHAAAVA